MLAVLDASAEPMQVIKKIHSLEYFGTYTNRLIEAAAGFCMMLVVTGIYLWWPRGQTAGSSASAARRASAAGGATSTR